MVESFELRRVRDAADWDAARTLRLGHADEFDRAHGTATYLLLAGERALGTTRSSAASPQGGSPLPCRRVFGAELASAFGDDATIVEASLTFVDPRAAPDPQEVLLRLFKVHMLRCAAEEADALVVAVRDSQIGLYRRLFNMEILSGAEAYPDMASPRVLMGLAFREQAPVLLRRLPALAASPEDAAEFARGDLA